MPVASSCKEGLLLCCYCSYLLRYKHCGDTPCTIPEPWETDMKFEFIFYLKFCLVFTNKNYILSLENARWYTLSILNKVYNLIDWQELGGCACLLF